MSGAIKQFPDVFAIASGRFPCRDHEKSTILVKGEIADRAFETLPAVRVESLLRICNCRNLIDVNDDFKGTGSNLVKTYKCHFCIINTDFLQRSEKRQVSTRLDACFLFRGPISQTLQQQRRPNQCSIKGLMHSLKELLPPSRDCPARGYPRYSHCKEAAVSSSFPAGRPVMK